MTLKLDLGNRRPLTPSLVLGIHALPTVPTGETIFKVSALRE